MPSHHEWFWQAASFAVVGRSEAKPFPVLTYGALKGMSGKTVYPVDPSRDRIEGDPAYPDLESLPEPVEAVVLEVPREETADWIEKIAEAGIRNVWIHMGRETPEALKLAEEGGLDVRSGTCAVQYLTGGFPHNVHRLLRKLAGRW
jgi:predicted CoA-binding protein